jgi:hypothetical protein
LAAPETQPPAPAKGLAVLVAEIPRSHLGRREPPLKEKEMDLIQLVVILIVVGVLLWLAETYIPMDAQIKRIMRIVVIVAVVLWLIGVFVGFPHIPIRRIGD